MPKPTGLLERPVATSDTFWYTAKTKLLGPPLVNEQLGEQRLSKPLALGVLSPDGISSSAYGTEEILIALLPVAGLAAFTLILPLTLVILFVMILVVLSYREIVMVYIRPGGSYVVARENFGPRIAQICAVALLIDYVVTVAVQVAAGTAAVASAIPAIGPYKLEICVGVVVLMAFGNLRGLKEAGRAFAVPTYLFSGSVILMIVVGLIREAMGNLHAIPASTMHGTYALGDGTDGIVSVVMIFTLLKAFANGGASLTGIEAVSDAVGAFNPPEGRNARTVLVTEGLILGVLVAGISWLAHTTHATPRILGYPTVLAQEAQAVFGSTVVGHLLFLLVQLATMLILYTGGEHQLQRLPVPDQLRGGRLVPAPVAAQARAPAGVLQRDHLADRHRDRAPGHQGRGRQQPGAAVRDRRVHRVLDGRLRHGQVPHQPQAQPGWRPKFIINFSAGVLTLIVVIIFAVVKFTEGAWVVLLLFAILVPALIRLNTEYRAEAEVLDTVTGEQPPPPPHYSRRVVFVLVDSFDLATLAALRYARSLRPTQIRAVHFVIDSVRAEKLRDKWTRADRGVALDFIDCPDRRLIKAATDLAEREVEDAGTHVTMILPRRSYSALLGRLLHDRTADKIAAAVSRIPRSAATIVPYDVPSRVAVLQARQAARSTAANAAAKAAKTAAKGQRPGATGGWPQPVVIAPPAATGADGRPTTRPATPPSSRPRAWPSWTARAMWRPRTACSARPARRPAPGVTAIGAVSGGKVAVEGKVRVVEIRPVERNSVLAVEINDSTGNLTAMFYGRSHIPGLICGARVRFSGSVGLKGGHPVMINPAYELVSLSEE